MRRVIDTAMRGWTRIETSAIGAALLVLAGLVVISLNSSRSLYQQSADLTAQAQQLAADPNPTQQVSNQMAVLLARSASADSQGSDVATACVAAISGLAVTIGLAVAHGKKIRRLVLEDQEAQTALKEVKQSARALVEPERPSPRPSARASTQSCSTRS